jgi:guanine deaminase
MLIYRARVFTPVADPFETPEGAWRYWENGYLAIDDGRIASVGDWADKPEQITGEVVQLGSESLISPGFIDTHLHAPQLEMIGSYGGHLLEWLERYTFPTEARFEDEDHARRVAEAFYPELLRNGTTTALIFSTIHARATHIFFEEAAAAGFRGIIGKTMMDRNAPAYLLEDAQSSYDESKRLIECWKGNDLLAYAITPRFAPTSTEAMLELAGALKKEHPDCYVHSHVSENVAEVEWVRELFPTHHDYVSVYEHYGLVDDRTVLAHGIHLTDEELARLAMRGGRVSHCPNSNLFLGSGLFPMKRVRNAGVLVALGSDIGAGTTPSLFNAMADAYKVQQVQGNVLDPFHLWYLATLGGARVLSLDDRVGSLEEGKEADFIVIDLQATPLLEMRTVHTKSVEDLLAGLIFMGDDRVVRKTFVRGREVSRRI